MPHKLCNLQSYLQSFFWRQSLVMQYLAKSELQHPKQKLCFCVGMPCSTSHPRWVPHGVTLPAQGVQRPPQSDLPVNIFVQANEASVHSSATVPRTMQLHTQFM